MNDSIAGASPVDQLVMPPALDFEGNEVPRNCENCDDLHDDGDLRGIAGPLPERGWD